MANLQEFVDAAIAKGSFPENHIALRKMVQDVCGTRRDRLSTQEIIDDVLEELEYFGYISKQPTRKTTRYFPRPKRAKNKREEYVLGLAKRFVSEDGRNNARGNVEKTKGSWAFQESRARNFLEVHEGARTLRFNVTLTELLSAIRSLNAQKAVQTKLVRKRVARKPQPPEQGTLF